MSIRVMVVEDEPPILRTIERMIQKSDDEFVVCHTAKNGTEAVDYLHKAPVDIIFTDIRMPVVDGLALMEIVHNEYPNIFIVVLSGYQEFEYAKHAMRNNAFDYLLKPVTGDVISKTLANLKIAYYQRRRRGKTTELLANIHQVRPDDNALHSDTYLVMLICAGPAPLFGDDDLLLPGSTFWDDSEYLPMNDETDWLFLGRTPAERILISELTGENCIENTSSNIFTALSDISSIPLTALYCGKPISFSDVGAAIRVLQQNLPGIQRLGESLLQSIDSVSNPPRETFFPSVEKDTELREPARALANALIRENNDATEACLIACLDVLKAKGSSYIAINDFFDVVLLRYENVKPLPDDVRPLVYETIYQALSYSDLRMNLLNLFKSLRMKEDIFKAPEFVGKLKKYLDDSYRKPITGTDLSRQFGFVPSYISRIFRQSFGCSPANYITALRIEEAKRLLREQPDLLIKEVAVLVGFKDQYHFSKTFKKKEGIWPTNYKG